MLPLGVRKGLVGVGVGSSPGKQGCSNRTPWRFVFAQRVLVQMERGWLIPL